jgi:hypothetical protein
MIPPGLEELFAIVDEMKKFPRGSVQYATLKIHFSKLLEKFLDEASDELLEYLWERMPHDRKG